MDNMRIKNAAQKIRGRMERTVGKLTGNKKLEARGSASQAAGSVRPDAGKAKEPAASPVKLRSK